MSLFSAISLLYWTFFRPPDVLAVGDVELLLGLLAGQNSLVAVDDNHEIAAVHVGGVIDLLLAAQQNSGPQQRRAQALAGSVEQVPLTLDFSGFTRVVPISISLR